jgi:hypothetical protein
MIKGFALNIWEHNLMMVAWGKVNVNVLGKLWGSKRTRLCLGSKMSALSGWTWVEGVNTTGCWKHWSMGMLALPRVFFPTLVIHRWWTDNIGCWGYSWNWPFPDPYVVGDFYAKDSGQIINGRAGSKSWRNSDHSAEFWPFISLLTWDIVGVDI